MKSYLPLLQSTSLFSGLTAEELQGLLSQLGAAVRSYGKGEALVLAGEPSHRVGVVLTGELEAYRPGPQGARIPITRSPAHQLTLQNLVRTISDKYFSLSRRIDLLVLKSLRAKVCAYLLSEAERAGSLTFSIPFSRIQLADYLNCDRSALSRELSLMQRDGLLDTYKSSFKLLEPDVLKQMVQ